MKKNISLILLIITMLIPLNGCAMPWSYVQSPGIRFDNLSNKLIKNINCVWSGHKLETYRLLPGQGSSESFGMRSLKKFYGHVHLSWENAAGQKFEKNFIVTEKDLPISDIEEGHKRAELKDYSHGTYVKFDFTQEGVEFYTSHTPGAAERGKQAGDIKYKIRKSIR